MPKRKSNMKTQLMKLIFSTVAMLTLVVGGATSAKAQEPLPSWNAGPAKQAILAFVKEVTDNKSNPKYVAPEDRIATFDQDGTLWVEHPMYTQVMYCLERVPSLVEKKPELKNIEPFKSVLSGNREAMAKLPMKDLEKILAATLTGMSVDQFSAEVKEWLASAKHTRLDPRYPGLTCQTMEERPQSLRGNGLNTYNPTPGAPGSSRPTTHPVS